MWTELLVTDFRWLTSLKCRHLVSLSGFFMPEFGEQTGVLLRVSALQPADGASPGTWLHLEDLINHEYGLPGFLQLGTDPYSQYVVTCYKPKAWSYFKTDLTSLGMNEIFCLIRFHTFNNVTPKRLDEEVKWAEQRSQIFCIFLIIY